MSHSLVASSDIARCHRLEAARQLPRRPPPFLAPGGSQPRPRLNGACLGLLVGGALAQLGFGLRSVPASGVVPAIAVADATPPPAPSPPCPSVLWRPVERSRMPGAALHQLAYSETC